MEWLISRRELMQAAALAGITAYGATRLTFPPEAAAASWDRSAYLAYADRGYVIVPTSPSLPGLARILRIKPQRSAPHPGPTLVLELLAHRRLRKLTATVRYAPAKSPAQAERVASRLRHTS